MKFKYTENYHVKDDAIFKDYVQKKKNLSEHSIRAYRNSLNKLCKATEETLYNMVEICKKEQKPRIEEDNSITIFSPNDFDSSINIYLGQFSEYCEAEGNKNTTINDNMRAIRTFFNFYEIKLPTWKPLEDDSEDWYLLTKEDIRFVLNDSTILHSALITFLLSTGMREEDACSLTIGDFMDATSKYHNYVDVEDFVDNAPNDMKGYWNFEPQKTQRYKIECKTFNSPESSNYILQSLRKIKNEYIPYKNKKDGLKLKISKKSALFGSRNSYYLNSLTPQAVTDTFHRKNAKLHEWNISQIDQKIKNKEISEEDREENIKKIPKFHPHGLRKYFCTTVHKYGEIRTCLVLEGHRSKISTDKFYVKITKDDVERVYNKALTDLSIAPVEAKIITDSEAEELREEVKSLNKKIEEKDEKIVTLESKLQERESKDKEIEERLWDIEENILAQAGNPARFINRTKEEFQMRISIQLYLNGVNDREDKIAKRIQEFNEEELFAVCELAYEIAIKENLEDVEQAIKKAIFKVTTKPELVAKIGEYKKERKLNQEKIDKFLKILREEIAKIGIFDEEDLKEIGKPFMDKVNNILIDDIDEDFVHAEIEKYL